MPLIQYSLSRKVCLIDAMAMTEQLLQKSSIFGQFLQCSHDPSDLHLVSRARRERCIEHPTDTELLYPTSDPRRCAAYEENWTACRDGSKKLRRNHGACPFGTQRHHMNVGGRQSLFQGIECRELS